MGVGLGVEVMVDVEEDEVDVDVVTPAGSSCSPYVAPALGAKQLSIVKVFCLLSLAEYSMVPHSGYCDEELR
jgi:hypothetical protein